MYFEMKKRQYLLLPRSLPRHRRLRVDPTKRKVKISFLYRKSLHTETNKEVEHIIYCLKVRTEIKSNTENRPEITLCTRFKVTVFFWLAKVKLK